jgi:hypothetical protein
MTSDPRDLALYSGLAEDQVKRRLSFSSDGDDVDR